MDSAAARVETVLVSYKEVREANPSWNEAMIQDYLFVKNGVSGVAEVTDQNMGTLQEQIDAISSSLSTLQSQLSALSSSLNTTQSTVNTNEADIAQNASAIAQNSSDINNRLTDAPNDGNRYARQSGAWVVVP